MASTAAAKLIWTLRSNRPNVPTRLCTLSISPVLIREKREETAIATGVMAAWVVAAVGPGAVVEDGRVVEAGIRAAVVEAAPAEDSVIPRNHTSMARKFLSGFRKKLADVSSRSPRRIPSARSIAASWKNY